MHIRLARRAFRSVPLDHRSNKLSTRMRRRIKLASTGGLPSPENSVSRNDVMKTAKTKTPARKAEKMSRPSGNTKASAKTPTRTPAKLASAKVKVARPVEVVKSSSKAAPRAAEKPIVTTPRDALTLPLKPAPTITAPNSGAHGCAADACRYDDQTGIPSGPACRRAARSRLYAAGGWAFQKPVRDAGPGEAGRDRLKVTFPDPAYRNLRCGEESAVTDLIGIDTDSDYLASDISAFFQPTEKICGRDLDELRQQPSAHQDGSRP